MSRPAPRWHVQLDLTCSFIVSFQHPGTDILRDRTILSFVCMCNSSMYSILSSAPRRTPHNLSLSHSPQADVQDGLGPKATSVSVRGEEAWPIFNRLGNSWYSICSRQQLCPFQIFPSSRHRVQMHARIDPISLGSDLRPFLTYLVTRSNPACLGNYTCLSIQHPTTCDCNALVGWTSRAVLCHNWIPQSHRHDTPRLLCLQVCLAMSLISCSFRP
jgi:hypothetical protein